MPKRLLIFLLIFFFTGIIGCLIIFRAKLLKEKEVSRTAIFSISGGLTYPKFVKELIIDPKDPKEGEEQIFSIWVEDPDGIEKVTAVIKTNKGEKTIVFKLVEGEKTRGKWQGSWEAKDILIDSRYTYDMEFKALNKKGKENKVPFLWHFRRENGVNSIFPSRN
jgi:hypothetical protein